MTPTNKIIEVMGLRCIGCGLCEGVCPVRAVKIVEHNLSGVKPVVNKNICISCGLCIDMCPVPEIVKPDDLRRVKAIYQGRSSVEELYLHGASGGIVSSILYYLFDNNVIDAALVAFYDDKLNIYGDFIESKEEVVRHSGSYYQTCRQLTNIRKIHKYKSVVVVGLPCHIEAIKNYAKSFNLKNIKLTISLFCTIGRTRAGLKVFLNEKFGIDLDNIRASKYLSRYGEERAGKIIIKTQKNQLEFNFVDYTNDIDYFYTPLGCFNCRKIFGLNADISVGDDWGIKGNRKIALVVANTNKGAALLGEIEILVLREIVQKKGLLHLLKSQPNGTSIKIYRPVATKIILVLIKNIGLALKKIHFPTKVLRLIRSLVFLYIQKMAAIKANFGDELWQK